MRRAPALFAAAIVTAVPLVGTQRSGAVAAVTLTPIAAAVEPVELAFRADDTALYAVERQGTVQRLDGDRSTTVLDLTDVSPPGDGPAVLGLVFSADGDHAYVSFLDGSGDLVVAEFAVDGDGSFARDSQREVITVAQPYPNNRGGHLAVGPDGLLYVGVGDGGGVADPDRVGQSLVTMLGKLLRLDPQPSDELGYTIPSDNPYTELAGLLDELWSLGLQNPRQFSFDAETGDLWVADVGQRSTEEVTVDAAVDGRDAGRNTNFGWSAYEGEERINNDMTAEQHKRPLFTYRHEGGRCSIRGGARVRGDAAGALAGTYVFADFCSGEVIALPLEGTGDDIAAGQPVTVATTTRPTGVVAGPDGTLYVLSADAVNRVDA